MIQFDFELEMQVRDYECDVQGIVNNAVYQNYLEHCRHKFIQTVGLDFNQLHADGIDGVVIRAEIDYKFPLQPGDDFVIQLKVAKRGKLRIVFHQQIVRKSDEKLMLDAKIFTVLIRNGKPISPELFIEKFNENGIILTEL